MNQLIQQIMQMRLAGMPPQAAMQQMAHQFPFFRQAPQQMEAAIRQEAQRRGLNLDAMMQQARQIADTAGARGPW